MTLKALDQLALLIKEKLLLYGIKIMVSQFTMLLFGNVVEPRTIAIHLAKGTKKLFLKKLDYILIATFLQVRLIGY